MTRTSILPIAATFFLLSCISLLVWRRFDSPPQEPVTILALENSNRHLHENVRRGTIIETGQNEYLALQIGSDLIITMDQKTRVELDRIFTDERSITFTRGRIVVFNQSMNPFLVETNKTETLVTQGKTVFINYDFKQLVTIAPITGSVQAHIKNEKDYLLVPVPINISETSNPVLTKTTLDTTQGPSASFHTWTDQLLETLSSMIPPATTISPS